MSHPVTPLRPAPRKRSRRSFGKIKKLPSGRYRASYLGLDGQRRNGPVTFLAKQDADQWLAMRQAEIIEHKWKPPRTRRERGDTDAVGVLGELVADPAHPKR